MRLLFASGVWVDAETGKFSADGKKLAQALGVEFPGTSVQPLGYAPEAELESADVVSTLRSRGVSKQTKVLVIGGGRGTFRVTFSTPDQFRSGCTAAGFRHGTDLERMDAIEKVLDLDRPDLVVVTSGVYIHLAPESIPEGAEISSMTATHWIDGEGTQHKYPTVPVDSFFPKGIHGYPMVGLRSYISEGQLRKVTWVRGVPCIDPTFQHPRGRPTVFDCGSGECKQVDISTGLPGVIYQHDGTVVSALAAVRQAMA